MNRKHFFGGLCVLAVLVSLAIGVATFLRFERLALTSGAERFHRQAERALEGTPYASLLAEHRYPDMFLLRVPTSQLTVQELDELLSVATRKTVRETKESKVYRYEFTSYGIRVYAVRRDNSSGFHKDFSISSKSGDSIRSSRWKAALLRRPSGEPPA